MSKRQFDDEEVQRLEAYRRLYQQDLRSERDFIQGGFFSQVMDEFMDEFGLGVDVCEEANRILADIQELVSQQTGQAWDPMPTEEADTNDPTTAG